MLYRNAVTSFTSDEAAIADLACHEPPNVVISDYRLSGGIDGLEAVIRLCEHWGAGTPAILLTGDTTIKDLARIHAPLHTSGSDARNADA